MSGPPPATIDLSTRQRALLERLRQRQTAPQRLIRRVLILLTLAANPCLQATARDLGLNRISVRLWRDRWLDAPRTWPGPRKTTPRTRSCSA